MADKDDEYPEFDEQGSVDRDRSNSPPPLIDRDEDDPLFGESLDDEDFQLPEDYPLGSASPSGPGTPTQSSAPVPPPWNDTDLDDFSPHDTLADLEPAAPTGFPDTPLAGTEAQAAALNELAERDLATLGEDTEVMPSLEDDGLDTLDDLETLDDLDLESEDYGMEPPVDKVGIDSYPDQPLPANSTYDEELSRDVEDLLREQDGGDAAWAAPDAQTQAVGAFPEAAPEPPLDDPFDLDDELPTLSISEDAQQRAAREPGDSAESDHDDTFSDDHPAGIAASSDGNRETIMQDAPSIPADSMGNSAPDEGAAGGGSGSRWPLLLIGVAAVALLLLGIGGYGVLQERSALQEEIRKLQARLATAVSQEEARANRLELQTAVQRNRDLEQELGRLEAENTRLSQGLEQLQAEASAQAETAAQRVAAEAERVAQARERALVEARAAEEAATARSNSRSQPATAPAGNWFVNFGSYAQREVAERWRGRLKPGAGEVLIQDSGSNGRPLFRLRVVGLADRDTAERIARELERAHRVERLWVGRDSG